MYSINQYQETHLGKNKLERNVLTNCLQRVETTQKLVNNCSAAYTELGACLVSQENCNINSSSRKLKSLNQEKIILEEKLKSITEELSNF